MGDGLLVGVPPSKVTQQSQEPTPAQPATPPAPVTPPEPPVREVYPEDVNKVIEKARLEERKKVQDRLSQLERENGKLSGQLESTVKENETLKKSTTQPAQPSGTGTPDLQAVAREAAAAVVAQMQPKMDELSAQNAVLQAELRRAALEGYRQKKIQEAAGRIIPALVAGSSEDEIDVAVIRAKKAYEDALFHAGIVPPAGAVPGSPSLPPGAVLPASPVSVYTQPAPGATVAAPRPVGAGTPPAVVEGQPTPDRESSLRHKVRGMSREEYAKNRMNLRKEATDLFKTGGGATDNPMVR